MKTPYKRRQQKGAKNSLIQNILYSFFCAVLLAPMVARAQIITTGQSVYQSANPKTNTAVTVEDMIHLDYSYFFGLNPDLTSGIKGTNAHTSQNVSLSVYAYDDTKANGKGKRIYYSYARPQDLNSSQYARNTEEVIVDVDEISGFYNILKTQSDDIKMLAQNNKIYIPGACKEYMGNVVWRLISKLTCLCNDEFCEQYYTPVQPVLVEVTATDPSVFIEGLVPGLVGGVVTINNDNNKVVINPKGLLQTYCASASNQPLCVLYNKVRTPTYSANSEDLYVAQHRGYWGNNLGDGVPENTSEAVQAGFNFYPDAKIVEMDLTITKDDELMMMHDYVMKRLTTYTGDEFSFDLSSGTIEGYYARKRNETASDKKISRFTDVLDKAVDNNAIVMIDIKEQQAKMAADGTCLANCDFKSAAAQADSWKKIVKNAIRQAEVRDRVKNVIVKTYYAYDEVLKALGGLTSKVLYTPILVSNNARFKTNGSPDIQKMCQFIDDWHKRAPGMIACFETDFFNKDDIMLQAFSRGGTNYQNLLHYIYSTTGRRSGIFSEEPVNPKGTVNRWGEWKMKDSKADQRGDPFFLLSIPYGNIMLITSDRIDIWKEIKEKF